MRLVCEIKGSPPEVDPFVFSALLTEKAIHNECEESLSPTGETLYRIWVYDEDELAGAIALYERYREDPSQFKHIASPAKLTPRQEEPPKPEKRSRSPFATHGPLSILILAAVVILFFWAQLSRKEPLIPPKIDGVKEAPSLPRVERKLLYDYPNYFALRDELLKVYTPEDIKEGKAPSDEATALLDEIKQTTVWNGLYDRYLDHVANPKVPFSYSGPMFEKIKAGEYWRLVTPCLLHLDLLHIFFNVLWFLILTSQIEFRIGSWRYLFLLLTTGIFSNTAQYLMSGSFFMGLSGLICGMAAFIWARQQIAPWEGYLLHRLTLIFLLIFVIGIFALQLLFFFLELFFQLKLQIPIANTAHIVGGVVGYLLGRLKYFSLKTRRS